MLLTPENYYSAEANLAYLSASQYKAFRRCEAAALAELKGQYVRRDTTALLVGSYIDAHFEGTLERFTARHPELFRRDGTLKAEFQAAHGIIDRLEADQLFSLLLSGKKQVIKTGSIAGVPFKIKMDSLLDARSAEAIAVKFPGAAEALGFRDGAAWSGFLWPLQ